jgi:hypothetical protein
MSLEGRLFRMHLYTLSEMDGTMRPGEVLALTMGLVVVAAGCLTDNPQSQLSRIPKVIIDRVENATLVTVMALGEVRYDLICLNYTAGGELHNSCARHRYVMDALVTNETFTLNVTVQDRTDVYMFNASVRVDLTDLDDTRFWVQEEDATKERDHSSPYTIVMEWRYKVGEA